MIDTPDGKKNNFSSFTRIESNSGFRKHSWLNAIRKEAIARFDALGFPTTQQEEWRFTDVSPIAEIPFTPAGPPFDILTISEISSFTMCETGCTQLVFLNGYYSEFVEIG